MVNTYSPIKSRFGLLNCVLVQILSQNKDDVNEEIMNKIIASLQYELLILIVTFLIHIVM